RPVGIADDLRQPLAVAQVDEDHAAVIATAMHPAVQRDGPVQVLGRDLAGVAGPHQVLRFSVAASAGATGSGSVGGAAPAPSEGGRPRSSGATTPIDTTYFSAWSTLMFSATVSARGIIRKNPEVGFGVVGTYTEIRSTSTWRRTSSAGAPVRKPIVQTPRRGYCTSSAWRNAWPPGERIVSLTCFTLE